jgi:hypothetical protein
VSSLIQVERDWFSPNQFIVLVDGRQVINHYFPTPQEAETYAATLRQAPFVAAMSASNDGVDITINGSYIGSFPEHEQALTEANHVARALTQVQTIDATAASPLIPFGIDAGPEPDLSTLTPADIARATEQLVDFYETSHAIVSRALNAYNLALAALTEQYHPAEVRTVRVRENGDVTIRGSKPYWISSHGCTCKDYQSLVYGKKYAGSGADSGMCKHTLCREILRLTQARKGILDSETGNKTAFVEIGAGQLQRALRALLKTEASAITIEVSYFHVRFSAGEVVKQIVSESRQGWGIRSLTLDVENVRRLTTELTPLATAGTTINLMLDAREMEISVFGAKFGFAANAVVQP